MNRAISILREIILNPDWLLSNRRDYACAECAPGSDILREGFRCLLHEAHALVALRRETCGACFAVKECCDACNGRGYTLHDEPWAHLYAAVAGRMIVEGATDMSDAEIERTLGACVAPNRLIPCAKAMRDRGILVGDLHEICRREEMRR